MTCSFTTAIKSYHPQVIKGKPWEAVSIAEDIFKLGSFLFHVDHNIERNELIMMATCTKNIFIIPSSVYSMLDTKFDLLWTFGESFALPTEEDGCLVLKTQSTWKHNTSYGIFSSFSSMRIAEDFEYMMKEKLIRSLTERIHLSLPSEDELLLIEESKLYNIFLSIKYGITPSNKYGITPSNRFKVIK
jgi:hypothetical protein